MTKDEAVVAVFGDLGRSPRMIDHTRELLKAGFNVHLIGYAGGSVNLNSCILISFHSLDIDDDILTSEGVKLHFVNSFSFDFIKKYFDAIDKYLKIVVITVRLFLLSVNLIFIFSSIFFFGIKSPKIMIIQVHDT